MRKKFSVTLLTLFLAIFYPIKVKAATPSLSRTRTEEETRKETPLTPSPVRVRLEEEVQERVGTSQGELQKIKELREAVKEKVQEKIQEIKKGIPRAYVGEITKIDIDNSNFTLETRSKTLQITTNEETKIIGAKKENLQLADLKIGNFCIAMGYLTDENTLQAKRIVVIPKPKPPAREVAFGKVIDISAEEKILTVKNERKGLTYTVEVTDKTMITKKLNNKIEKVNFSSIEINDHIVTVGTPTENEEKIITAKIIHIIPGLSKKTPFPSPTPEE